MMHNQLAIRVRGVLRRKEEILFCYNKKQKFYFLPGGTLELGEQAPQCLIREFQEECRLTITVGNLIGCLECHWQDEDQQYQEFNLIFEVHTSPDKLAQAVQSIEPHISFEWLHLTSVVAGAYSILPATVVQFLQQSATFPFYQFENQLNQ